MRVRGFVSIVLFILATTVFANGATPASKWAKLDGAKIHYYDIGKTKQKKALVLIHGWTCSADFW